MDIYGKIHPFLDYLKIKHPTHFGHGVLHSLVYRTGISLFKYGSGHINGCYAWK